MFESLEYLLEQDEFVQKQRELGKEEGEMKGEMKASQKLLIAYVTIRYPSLIELAQQQAAKSTQLAVLQNIIDLIFAAPDEATVHFILSSPSSAA